MARKPAAKAKSKLSWRRPATLFGTIACLAAGYFAIVWIGEQAGLAVKHRERYRARFAEIDCEPPPGLDRGTFLTEVRYLGNLPAEYSNADPDALKSLAAAFAKHPWVKEAAAETNLPAGPNPVKLTFRTPALAVMIEGSDTPRVVDTQGILLPLGTSTVKLPLATLPRAVPAPDAGTPWTHPDIPRALDLVKDHNAKKLEKTASGWRITQANGRVLTVNR